MIYACSQGSMFFDCLKRSERSRRKAEPAGAVGGHEQLGGPPRLRARCRAVPGRNSADTVQTGSILGDSRRFSCFFRKDSQPSFLYSACQTVSSEYWQRPTTLTYLPIRGYPHLRVVSSESFQVPAPGEAELHALPLRYGDSAEQSIIF